MDHEPDLELALWRWRLVVADYQLFGEGIFRKNGGENEISGEFLVAAHFPDFFL